MVDVEVWIFFGQRRGLYGIADVEVGIALMR